MLNIEDIVEVRTAKERTGYEIVFPDNRIIWIRKRRTIIGLLLLIKYEYCSEADLVGANDRLAAVKKIMQGKMNPDWIQDRYGDANKPFSELWTEEGFSCVRAEGMRGNRQYVLNPGDHDRLFQSNAKAIRIELSDDEKSFILESQGFRCNICGARLQPNDEISAHTFAKDRVRTEFDHRIPIDRGGGDIDGNYQALCHYCNKCKRQMCFVCSVVDCSEDCALVDPENHTIVQATGEDISDRITVSR